MKIRIVIGLMCWIALTAVTLPAVHAQAVAAKPEAIALPGDFKPAAGDFADEEERGMFMGIAGLRGRALKERNGFEAVYVVQAPKDRFKEDYFAVGDVILGANLRPAKGDPVGTFKRAAERAQNSSGALTFTRWRKGKIEKLSIPFQGPEVPDLTKGGDYDPKQEDWNLGTLGAEGWIWSIPHQSTLGAKQIYITQIAKGSPADGVLKIGDVILGANGKDFTRDCRKELAHALTQSETTRMAGKLALKVWNAGETREVTVRIRTMGDYPTAAPYVSDKTKKIIDEGVEYLKKNGLGDGVQGKVNALGLLATGREDVMPLVRGQVEKAAAAGKHLEFKQNMETWSWGYSNLLLCEYYLATKDKSVLPAITEYSTMIARGQSNMGNWGHSMCVPYKFSDGTVYGITPGYGALNQAGLPCMISLALAKKCGVTNEHIELGIRRGSDFFRFYYPKGAIPYGDHSPEPEAHDDNGKSSIAAVMFDLLGEEAPARFFTKLTIASYDEREGGHTGNYFNMLWGPLGAARGGDEAAAAFMQRLEWFFDLERRASGAFEYQGKPGMANTPGAEHQYKGWDTTGSRLLAYCIPLHKLYITGKGRTVKDITGKELAQTLEAGALRPAEYHNLSTSDLLAKLSSWSPAARYRAAEALERKDDNVVPQLIAMLGSDNPDARYGACVGMHFAGRQSPEAADAVIAKGLGSSDEVMVFFALRAFSSYNKDMGLSDQAERALPVMLKLAKPTGPGALSMRLRNELAFQLFYSGNAQRIRSVARNGEGISKVDSDVLVMAVKDLLKVDFGAARSSVTAVYDKLSEDQLKLLWKDIYQAVHEQAPGDVMFSNGVRIDGLKLMAKHHTREGLDSMVWFLTNQKGHGSGPTTESVLKMMVDSYGGHAKAAIPALEKAAVYLDEFYGKQKLGDQVRQTIQKIQAAPTPDWKMVSIAQYLK